MSSSRSLLVFLFATLLIDSIGFGIILPVMPQLIMEVTGEDLSRAAVLGGWLLFLYAIVQFFSAPLMGNLSDRFGRRRVLLLSLLAFGLDYMLMGWAPTFGWLVLGRMIAGCVSSTWAVANAAIADTFPPDQRAKHFALLGAAFGGGFILGPVLGGFLGELGSRVPFYATAGLALANALFGAFFFPETLGKEKRRTFELSRANPFGAFLQIRRYPVVSGLVVAWFVFLIAHHALPSTWSYFTMARFDWSASQIGFSLGFVGVLMMIVQAWLIRVVLDAWGPGTTAVLGLGGAMISFLGYSLAWESWMIYLFLVLGATQGFLSPAVQGLMSARIPADAQGELQGALGSVMSLATICSPLVMTNLFGYFTSEAAPVYFPGAPYFLSFLLCVVSLVIFLPQLRQAGTPRPAPD